MIVVGLDLHVRNSFLHVEDQHGTRLKRGRVANTLGAMAEFLAAFESEEEPIRVVLESTTNSRAMHGLLHRYAKEAKVDLSAQVLDARKLRVIAESVAKCDKLDAAVLAELARSNLRLPVCYVPDDDVFALREHLRARTDLVRIRTMLKNRVHAILHRRGILLEGDLFTKAGRNALQELTMDDAGRAIMDRFLGQLDAIADAVDESTKQLKELGKTDRWCKPLAIATTMPGIGLITGLTVLAELGSIDRFKSRASVSNWAGLVPTIRDSNTKHYSGHITRRGSTHLRGAMTEAAWQAISRSRRYGAMYTRIGAKKSKQIAIVAVARQMLEDVWTMLRKDVVYQDANELKSLHEVKNEVVPGEAETSRVAIHSTQVEVIAPDVAG